MLLAREQITSDNHGPIVSIITWVLLVPLVLSVTTKAAIKYKACHALNTDDSVLLVAMVILANISL